MLGLMFWVYLVLYVQCFTWEVPAHVRHVSVEAGKGHPIGSATNTRIYYGVVDAHPNTLNHMPWVMGV